MKNPPDRTQYFEALIRLKLASAQLYASLLDTDLTSEAIADIELATSIWKQADRLEKEAKAS